MRHASANQPLWTRLRRTTGWSSAESVSSRRSSPARRSSTGRTVATCASCRSGRRRHSTVLSAGRFGRRWSPQQSPARITRPSWTLSRNSAARPRSVPAVPGRRRPLFAGGADERPCTRRQSAGRRAPDPVPCRPPGFPLEGDRSIRAGLCHGRRVRRAALPRAVAVGRGFRGDTADLLRRRRAGFRALPGERGVEADPPRSVSHQRRGRRPVLHHRLRSRHARGDGLRDTSADQPRRRGVRRALARLRPAAGASGLDRGGNPRGARRIRRRIDRPSGVRSRRACLDRSTTARRLLTSTRTRHDQVLEKAEGVGRHQDDPLVDLAGDQPHCRHRLPRSSDAYQA